MHSSMLPLGSSACWDLGTSAPFAMSSALVFSLLFCFYYCCLLLFCFENKAPFATSSALGPEAGSGAGASNSPSNSPFLPFPLSPLVCLFVCLSVCLFVCLIVWLFVCLFVRSSLSFHLFFVIIIMRFVICYPQTK